MALNLNFLFQLHMGRNEEAGEHFNIYEKHETSASTSAGPRLNSNMAVVLYTVS